MIIDDVKTKLMQIEAAINFYDELGGGVIRNDVALENTQLKMIFAKKEILKLILETKNLIDVKSPFPWFLFTLTSVVSSFRVIFSMLRLIVNAPNPISSVP